jgi:predicted dehydrogenase
LGLDVEDNASVLIRFEDGAVLLLEVGWGNCDDKDVALTFFSCSNGGAFLNPLRLTRRQGDKIITLHDKVVADEVQLYRRSFSRELTHYLECIRENTKPISPGQDAVAVMEIIDRLYESSGH